MVLAGGTGLPIGLIPEYDLATMIDDAESDIDAYMAFPEENSLGFGAGSRAEAQWWDPGTRRVNFTSFPIPVQSVDSFIIQVSQRDDGSPVQATVDPNLVVIVNDYGYFEVVALAIALYSLAPILAQIGMMQPVARFAYTAGYSIPKAGWPLYRSAAADGMAFLSRRPAWDPGVIVSVSAGGVVVDPSRYSVDYFNGAILFTTAGAPPAGMAVTASFAHTVPDEVTDAARACLIPKLHEWFANARGMAGLDMQQGAGVTLRRRGTYHDAAADTAWQSYLSQFKTTPIGSAS